MNRLRNIIKIEIKGFFGKWEVSEPSHATHDLDLLLETCDRVLVLNQGKLVANGSVQDILWNRKLLEKYNLELPFCLVGVPERFSEKVLEVSESTPKVQNVR